MNYLLIISCSQRKIRTEGPVPAIQRYDGPLYRMLRKHPFKDAPIDIAILSAHYGLLLCNEPISDYDQKMTLDRASDPDFQYQVQNRLNLFRKLRKYDQVFINLGKTYMHALENYNWGLISTLEANGGIGQRTSQVKAWIDRIYAERKEHN